MTTARPPASMPLPVPNQDNQEFWDGCKQHEFRIQRCRGCGTFRHYPRPACHNCASFDTEWVTVSGRGTVYSYTIAYYAFHPYFRDKIPYPVVVVELDEAPGVRMASNIVDCPLDEVHIGMAVDVVWEDLNPDVSIYRFRPAVLPGP